LEAKASGILELFTGSVMNVIIEIQRYNPEKDKKPYYKNYEVEVNPRDRILDILMLIKRKMDSSLSLRKSCSHGVCGSDAMVINGVERLACKTLIGDIVKNEDDTVKIEPLRMPVQRDLMVDQTRFFENYRQVKPYLINNEVVEEKERIQTPEERKSFDTATKCILCASCYSACPVIQKENPNYLGPASIVQASRFINDSRDKTFKERLLNLDYPNGIWPCKSYYKCTQVCPRNIEVTKLINATKKKIIDFRSSRKETINR
jgi:succinate dehydrogenase / fumarate reductase iron-sulfur subunit